MEGVHSATQHAYLEQQPRRSLLLTDLAPWRTVSLPLVALHLLIVTEREASEAAGRQPLQQHLWYQQGQTGKEG